MSGMVLSQTAALAKTLDISAEAGDLVSVMKATAFKGQVSDAQMAALLVVANQYKLNPWTKEIYAFPDKHNGIVPVVGVDGWSRIINSHPQFDGMSFQQDDQSCTCVIHRKDRKHPIQVTEWMAECKRDGVGPWKSHPRRMLRHKAMIQCARLAFGFVGIYEQDEAERVIESQEPANRVSVVDRSEPRTYPQADFDANFPKWKSAIEAGRADPESVIAMVESKGLLSEQQKKAIRDCAVTDAEVTTEEESQ